MLNSHEKIGYTILLSGVILVIGLILWVVTSEKYVKEYSLGSNGTGLIQIVVNMENASDERITINGLEYREAVNIVDSLNASLHRYQHISK